MCTGKRMGGATPLLLSRFHGTIRTGGSTPLLLSKNHGTISQDYNEKMEKLQSTLQKVQLKGTGKKGKNNIRI
jgi:hypothetical protein